MHPLFFVSAFLLVFTLLTSSEMLKYKDRSYIEKVILESVVMQEEQSYLIEQSHFKEIVADPKEPKPPDAKPKPHSPKPYNLEFDTYRPPDNARLNIYQVVMEREEEQKPIRFRTLFVDLLYKLYGNEPFFHEIPHFPERLLEKLCEQKEAIISFQHADELSCLEFKEPRYTEILHKMLKGDIAYPSLLQFLSFHRKMQGERSLINLLFASEELLAIIFPEKMFQEVKKIRANYWQDIWLQEEGALESGTVTRSKLKHDFKERLLFLLEDARMDKSYIKAFDCSLGRMGSTLQYIDSHTGMLVREHIPVQSQN